MEALDKSKWEHKKEVDGLGELSSNWKLEERERHGREMCMIDGGGNKNKKKGVGTLENKRWEDREAAGVSGGASVCTHLVWPPVCLHAPHAASCLTVPRMMLTWSGSSLAPNSTCPTSGRA